MTANPKETTMLTEIFDERELDTTLTKELDDEAIALIEELGLNRQIESGTRICYPKPTADRALIMQYLFPTATRLEDYDVGLIPVRVLKEIRSYKTDHPTHRLVIRHSPPAQVKDPILLACIGDNSWSDLSLDMFDNKRMIARWGDALESWDTLLERAERAVSKVAEQALSREIAKLTMLRDAVRAGHTIRRVPQIVNMPEGW